MPGFTVALFRQQHLLGAEWEVERWQNEPIEQRRCRQSVQDHQRHWLFDFKQSSTLRAVGRLVRLARIGENSQRRRLGPTDPVDLRPKFVPLSWHTLWI